MTTDNKKTTNELDIERHEVKEDMVSLEEKWQSEGRVKPIEAVEYDRLSRRYEELTSEIRRPSRWHGP